MVSQKDATIELLRERIVQLERQSPDALLDAVTKRHKLALEEIERRDVDEAERKKLRAQAVERAHHDTLAGLDERLDEVLARLRRFVAEGEPPTDG